ncbi:xylose isomerase-like protein [Daedaleopsis nitida]|nr:xylose isomerase-like protein [Daedaleopsis nitida]
MSLRRSSRISSLSMCAHPQVSSRRPSRELSTGSSPSSTPISEEHDKSRPTKRARVDHSNPEDYSPNDERAGKDGTQRRRKAKIQPPDPSPDDFAPRAVNLWKVGPHVSSAGGVENAIVNAASVGANAFAIFLKSQRKWDSNPLKEESIAKFKARMKLFGYSASHVLPHGSYLVNLGNPDNLSFDPGCREKREKSFGCFLDDLKRCEQLDLQLYNFHPGSTVGAATMEQSIALIAKCINRAHKETDSVVIVLENMAGAGNIVGSRFSELGRIIEQVDDKTRVGVCLDTCHMYAAGYDITTQEGWNATMEEFDREVGMSYLRGMHINDSKAALASKKDRHENIGLGHLGLPAFAHILSDPRTRDIPLVLETPAYDVPVSGARTDRLAAEGMGVWRTEVSVLNRLSGRLPLDARADDDQTAGAQKLTEDELEAWRVEIKEAVEKASKAKDAKGKKPAASGGKRKRKVKGKDEEESDDDEDNDSC